MWNWGVFVVELIGVELRGLWCGSEGVLGTRINISKTLWSKRSGQHLMFRYKWKSGQVNKQPSAKSGHWKKFHQFCTWLVIHLANGYIRLLIHLAIFKTNFISVALRHFLHFAVYSIGHLLHLAIHSLGNFKDKFIIIALGQPLYLADIWCQKIALPSFPLGKSLHLDFISWYPLIFLIGWRNAPLKYFFVSYLNFVLNHILQYAFEFQFLLCSNGRLWWPNFRSKSSRHNHL